MQHAKSEAAFEEAKQYIPGGVNSPVRSFRSVGGVPPIIAGGAGSKLTDIDGNEYIDYVLSYGPLLLGHAHPVVTEAIKKAAEKGSSYGAPTLAETELAKLVCRLVPSMDMVRMVNSGTEATMSALRLARAYTGRDNIVKFIGCYHGHVDSLLVAAGSGALTFGEPDSAGVPWEMTQLTLTVPYNDREAVKKAFELHGSDIAAVILEPFPANAGLYFPQNDFLHFLREITLRHDALLIFDEVMTGFRVAPGGVQQLYGITPDLTCMGKVIGGGLPVGAFGGRSEIMDCLSPLGPVYQAGTLSGNPVAMAAGLAQLRELLKGNAYERLEQLGARMEEGIREALKKHGRNYIFHRAGSMFCLFFTEEEVYNLESAQKASKKLFKSFFWNMLEQGVYFAPSPYETGFISTAHTEEDIDRTVEAVRISLSRLG